MVLALPPWACNANALSKYTFPTDLGVNLPKTVHKSPDLKINGVRLLWAAITSGRPPALVPTVFDSSNAAYRQWRIWASLGMLEPDGTGSLRRTANFTDLDPTEKGHLNYALAGALTKAYAGEKLDSPWMAHLSLAAKVNYTIGFTSSRSRPDYFGVTHASEFIVGEAKGRIYVNAGLKGQLDGKQQTGTIKSIAAPGSATAKPVARYGVAVATGSTKIRMCVTDPPETVRDTPDPNDWIRAYYAFMVELAELVNTVDREGTDPFTTLIETRDWQRVRFVVPELARRWARGEGSPLRDVDDAAERLLEALQRNIVLGDPNPDLTYFEAV